MQMMFSEDALAGHERLAALNELFASSEHPMRMVSDAAEEFRATARVLDLAAVNVVELTSSSAEVLRTPGLIRQADPELCSVIVSLSGRLVVSQADREAVVQGQSLALYDSSQPFRIRLAPDGGTVRLVRAHLPRELLGLPAAGVGRLLARPLGAQAGFGGLLTRFLADAAAGSAVYRADDLPRMSTLARDLMTAVVAHHLDADSAVPDDSRQRTLLLRIEGFLRQHLPDPYLSPETVAAAHHMSVRHLHRLFGARGITVGAWIRQQRLEHARRDLADPALLGMPIHQIAARWGFKDHAAFTRSFRSAYGAPPKDFRSAPVPRQRHA